MIIDFHTHIFPPSIRDRRQHYLGIDQTFGEMYADPKSTMADADDLVRILDQDGVDRAVVMGLGWTDRGMAQEANDYVIESVRRYPDRLIGFSGVNPAWGGDASKELARCAESGLRGVGELHPDTQGYDLGNQSTMGPIMEVVHAYGMIVTTHSSEPVGHTYQGKGKVRPEALWRFACNFPEDIIVMAHWGGGLPFYALMPEVAKSFQNVYFDTAASPYLYLPAVFSTVASLVGYKKILFGSDYSLMRPRRLLRQARESGLVTMEVEAVIGGNAARLLRLGGRPA